MQRNKNVHDPSTWIPILRKSSTTTWEVFDIDFGEVGPDLEWDGDDGLGKLWGLYYKCPDMEYILRVKAALCNGFDATATARTTSLSVTNPTLEILKSYATRLTIGPQNKKEAAIAHGDHGLGHHSATLQGALEKHQEDILHLSRMGSNSEQSVIPQKMLQKIQKANMSNIQEANMSNMSKINLLIAHAGEKELSARKLKELGCNAEKTAKAIYEKEVDALNAMDYAPSPDYDALLGGDVMNTSPTSSAPTSNVFWRSILPANFHILEFAPDGNCFFRCISDQLNQDEGARHEFTRHQITNHISRNGDAFKDFLLLQDDHEDVSDLDGYLQKMGKNGAWEGHPEVHAAAWFYGVDITIYTCSPRSKSLSLNIE